MADQEKILEIVCDHLCKWPGEFKDPDDLWSQKCDRDCPLQKYLEQEEEE